MANKIGMIEYAGKGSEKKVIILTAVCQHCQRVATRIVDCPFPLQDALPGYIVCIGELGTLYTEAP